MSQTRAQLVSPVGVVTASGMSISGVVTASSFVGNGSGLTNLSVSYVPTAGIATYATTAGVSTLSQGLTGTPNISVGIVTANTLNDSIGSVRSIPQNNQTTSYQLQNTDAGKHISITTGGITVPSGVFSIGDVISIYNNSGSNQTITQGTSVTLRQAGTANTGSRTLSQYGLATVLCVASNTFAISGAGLT